MSLDPYAKRLLDMMAVASPKAGSRVTVEARRESFRKLMALSRSEAAVIGLNQTIPGPAGPIPLRIYTPATTPRATLPALVFFHGGGLVAGNLDTHDALCRTLAEGLGAKVVAVDYRLAPEHPFPAAIEDSFAATQWVFKNAAELEIDHKRIAVGGDSGGGTLAAVVTLMAREAGGPKIAFQLLLCPVLDFGDESPSRREFAEGYLLDRTTMQTDLACYAPGDVMDPRVSPLRALDLAGLPPAAIHTAEFDPLRDEGAAYAGRLADAGVAVSHTCHLGLIHHFYGLATVIPSAATAMDSICREARAALT
jgi:acetyl esterase/lipase